MGFSKIETEGLFSPYNTIRPEALQEGKGTGLGLALAKEIVIMHGGRVRTIPILLPFLSYPSSNPNPFSPFFILFLIWTEVTQPRSDWVARPTVSNPNPLIQPSLTPPCPLFPMSQVLRQSSVGKGSAFGFCIPFTIATAEDTAREG